MIYKIQIVFISDNGEFPTFIFIDLSAKGSLPISLSLSVRKERKKKNNKPFSSSLFEERETIFVVAEEYRAVAKIARSESVVIERGRGRQVSLSLSHRRERESRSFLFFLPLFFFLEDYAGASAFPFSSRRTSVSDTSCNSVARAHNVIRHKRTGTGGRTRQADRVGR